MNWYALFVHTGSEEVIRKYLHMYLGTSIRVLIPKRKVPEKKSGIFEACTKKVFPGYVLIQVNMSAETYHLICSIPHIIKMLGTNASCTPIPDHEMTTLLKLINPEDIIDYSTVYMENTKVVVLDGPLMGHEGIIKKIDKHTRRAKVWLHLTGNDKPKLVDLGVEILYATQEQR